jgi:hypothetical protein
MINAKKNLIEAVGLSAYVGDMVKIDLAGNEIEDDKKDIAKDVWGFAFNRNCSDYNKIFQVIRIRYKYYLSRSEDILCKIKYEDKVSNWIALDYFKKVK